MPASTLFLIFALGFSGPATATDASDASGAPASAAPAPAVVGPAPASAPAFEDSVVGALAVRPGGLTADDVAREAVISSPDIELRRAELMVTASSVDDTLSRFAPNVTVSATYSRISPADIDFGSGGATVGALNEGPIAVDPMSGLVVDQTGTPVQAVAFEAIEIPLNNYSLQASLQVPILDYALRLLPAKRGAEAETKSAMLQRDAEKVKVELDARVAYYDWVRAIAQVAIVEQSVESAQARLEDAKIGLAAGTLTSTDVERLEQLVLDAQLGVEQARSFEDLAAANVAAVMGRERADFELGEDVLGPPPPLEDVENREKLIAEALDSRLEIQALEQSQRALNQGERAARTGYYPRVDGFADFTYANPNQRFFPAESVWRANWTIGVTASWELRSFLQSRSQYKSAVANGRKVAASRAAVERGVRLEVSAAYEERRRALAAQQLTARALEVARVVYEEQTAKYAAGELTTTDLIAAESDRLNASLRQVNANIDVRVANAKLLRATGRMAPMSVPADQDDAPYEQVGFKKAGSQ